MKTHHSKSADTKPQPFTQACTIPRKLPAPICQALADEIRAQRVARDLSCYALAKLAGLMRETVCRAERRRSYRMLDTIMRIADVFGMRLDELLALAARRGCAE